MDQLNQVKFYLETLINGERNISVNESTLFILVGDFNVDSYNYRTIKAKTSFWNTVNEYKFFEKDLSSLGELKNVYYECHGIHPITYGEDLDNGGDKILTIPCDIGSKLSLDYILHIIPNFSKFEKDKTQSKSKLKIVYSTIQIEKFHVVRKPYTQLSDHYGLSVELQIDI